MRNRTANAATVIILLLSLAALVGAGVLFWAANEKAKLPTEKAKDAPKEQPNEIPLRAPKKDSPRAVAKEKLPVADLSPEQRAAWERARAKAEMGASYIFALSGVNDPKWLAVNGEKSVGFQATCRTTRLPIGDAFFAEEKLYFRRGDPFLSLTVDTGAETIAREPSIQIAAVVDLFSKRDPAVVAWYHSDGREVVKLKGQPSLAIRDSLAAHLFMIQQKIGD